MAEQSTARATLEVLAEEASRYRASFDLAPVGMAHVALGGEWLAVNRRLCELLGYSRERLLQLRFQDLTHPDDLAADLDQALRLLAGELESYTLIKRYIRPDGAVLWARLTGSLVRHPGGAPFHYLAVVAALSDVERADAERHARLEAEQRAAAADRQAERLALALDGADDGLWDWNVRTGVVYFSPRLCAMLGFDSDEVLPHVSSWEQRIHPDDLAHVRAALDEHLAGRSPRYETEHRLRCRDGSWKWILDRGRVVERDADGRALRMTGTHVDISSRRAGDDAIAAATAALAASEARYRALVSATSQTVWSCPPDGVQIAPQPSWQAFTGQQDDEVLGDGWLRALHPDDRPGALLRWSTAVQTASPFRAEFRVRRYDGEYRWMRASGVPLLGPDGRITEWVGMNADVTDARAAMDELRARETHAQHLLAIVGHDLRNPLGTILAGARTLELRASPQERDTVRILGAVSRASQRAGELVETILDFAGAALGGGIPIAPHDADLAQILAEAVSDARERAPERPIVCRVVADGEDRDVSAAACVGRWDAARLHQVFGNLLTNALTHGTSGTAIDVTLHDRGDRVVIEVANASETIPAAHLAGIFDPMTRVTTGSAARAGLGLGLYIVNELVQAHGGAVRAASEAGRTAFTVELPRSTTARTNAFRFATKPLPESAPR
jgi:PAS domain S-box-containing protein